MAYLPQIDDKQDLPQELSYKLKNNIIDFELVDLLNDYSESLRFHNQDFVKSLEFCDSAKKIAEELGYKLGLAWSLASIGSCLIYMDFSDEPQKILAQSLAIFRKLKNPKGEAHSLMLLGMAKLAKGDFVTAYDLVEEGLNLSSLTNYEEGVLTGYYFLSLIHEKLEDFDATIKYCKLALSHSENFEIDGRLYAKIGKILLNKSETKQAKNYLEKALKESETIQDMYSKAAIFIQLGKIFLLEKDVRKAKSYFNEGIKITRKIGLLSYSTDILDDISNSFIDYEEYHSALEILENFKNRTHLDTNPNRMAMILIKIAAVKIKLKQTDEAYDLLNQSWAIIEDGDNSKLKYKCQEAFADICELKDDWKSSLKHHKLNGKYKSAFEKEENEKNSRVLINRIKIQKQKDLKQFAKIKNTEVAQMIYRLYEKSDALNQAQQTIIDLLSMNDTFSYNTTNQLLSEQIM